MLPMAGVTGILTNTGERFAKLRTPFYVDSVDAVFEAMRVQ